MDRFEIVVTLLSFVYALALTHVLASAGALILERDRVRFSLTQALWMAVAPLLLFNNWLSLAALDGANWTARLSFEAFLFGVAQYVGCVLVSPRTSSAGEIDMAAHHDRHGRLFKAVFIGIGIAAMIGNVRHAGLFGRGVGEALVSQWPVLAITGLTAIALWRRDGRVQVAAASLLILLMLAIVLL